MISEADIWRSAMAMVKRYRDDAMQEAAERAETCCFAVYAGDQFPAGGANLLVMQPS